MSSNFVIRPAQLADAPQLSRIFAESWRHAYRGIVPQPYLDNLDDDRWIAFYEDGLHTGAFQSDVLVESGLPVGAIAYGPAREPCMENWMELIALYLLPSCTGQGGGHALLSHALSPLTRSGRTGCYLHVLEENMRARAFYAAHGFKPFGSPSRIEVGGAPLSQLQYRLAATPGNCESPPS